MEVINHLQVFYFMGRRRKNKSEEFFIANNYEVKHNLSHVKIPFFLKVIYKVKISEDNNGKPIYGTTDQIVRYLHYTKDEITKKFQEKGKEVIKIEAHTIPMPNICEKCHRKGIPRIERKLNDFYYHYTPKNDSSKNKSNRPEEHWLIYDHGKGKKCRIAQFDKNHLLFKLPKRRKSNLSKHFFPFYLESLKKELVA